MKNVTQILAIKLRQSENVLQGSTFLEKYVESETLRHKVTTKSPARIHSSVSCIRLDPRKCSGPPKVEVLLDMM